MNMNDILELQDLQSDMDDEVEYSLEIHSILSVAC